MKKNEYDVIIIGAGIGGLVCANYLIKFGKSVLLVEKNNQTGGYCTSFKKDGFIFDSSIHSIQDSREGSLLGKVFHELSIERNIKLLKANPSDTVLFEGRRIDIVDDLDATIKNFSKEFPSQKEGICNFLRLVKNQSFLYIFRKFNTLTFQEVLNSYFSNEEIKRVFSAFLSNLGSKSQQTSAVSGLVLLKSFILNGGYYPEGGMQVLPDSLTSKFKTQRGELLLRSEVVEILEKNGRARGIKLRDGRRFFSEVVISNIDPRCTLLSLIKKKNENVEEMLCSRKTSYPNLIIYLKLKKMLRNINNFGPGMWIIPSKTEIEDKIDFPFQKVMTNDTVFCSIASKLDLTLMPEGFDIVRLMINTDVVDKEFWDNHKEVLSMRLISCVEKVIPNLSDYIICKGIATPMTAKNYTHNRNGAICGWLNSPENISDPIMHRISYLPGLYFVGHWATEKYGNGGIGMVVDSGRNIAKKILQRLS